MRLSDGEFLTSRIVSSSTVHIYGAGLNKERPAHTAVKELSDRGWAIAPIHPKDGGATIWAETVRAIRHKSPGTTLETLIPDFAGKWDNLQQIIEVAPEVVSHNIETVRRLTKGVRKQAKYERSLEVLKRLNDAGIRTKSGMMLGLGESKEEVVESMDDLINVGVKVLTLGQYLQPTPSHLPVFEFIHPDLFEEFRVLALDKGFMYVESSPLVRSSYHAEKHVK